MDITERKLTESNGLIQKELKGSGWHWERRPDSRAKNKAKLYYDGVLYHGNTAYPTEVKLADNILTDTERKKFNELTEKKIKCIIIRYFSNGRVKWFVEFYGESCGIGRTLLEALNTLKEQYANNVALSNIF